MESRLRDLALYRLEKSKKRLLAANLLFEKKFYLDAISKAYYAMYQAARAILATKGLDRRKHLGISSFIQSALCKDRNSR